MVVKEKSEPAFVQLWGKLLLRRVSLECEAHGQCSRHLGYRIGLSSIETKTHLPSAVSEATLGS